MKFSLFIAIISLVFVASCQGQTWCTVRPGASDAALQVYIIRTCPQVDCGPIQPGGSCYNPNTLQNHASYVLNLAFRKFGSCDFQLGLPSVSDPSFGSCRYS